MTDPASADLDRLLEAWARDVRLPLAEVDGISRQILAESAPPAPAGLPTSWWRTFAFQMAEVVVETSRPLAARGAGVLG